MLAFVVGAVAFAFMAVIDTTARGHVPGLLFGLLLLLVALTVARVAGILYSLPVGVVTILAFDWYFLPPLRQFNAATALVLGLFLVMASTVGASATLAGRRATGSEQARDLLADEQAALRRVATLVARQPPADEVFAAVTEEVGKLLRLDGAHLHIYGRDGTATVAGAWALGPVPMPVGTSVELDGDNVAACVFRTGKAARIEDYTTAQGATAARMRATGVRAAIGCPILVNGRPWGAMTAGSLRPELLAADTEVRMEAFTELVATAIANAEARTELEQVAAEQAALRRVATLRSFQPELAGQRGWCGPGWWCSAWWVPVGIVHDHLSAGGVLAGEDEQGA